MTRETFTVAAIAFVCSTAVGYWYLGGQLRERILYAEQDAARWRDEFTVNASKVTASPCTDRIECLAALFRFVRTFLPVIGGAFFLIALFTQPKVQEGESHSGSSASPTPVVFRHHDQLGQL